MREGITCAEAVARFLDDLRLQGREASARTYGSLLRPLQDFTPDTCRALLRQRLSKGSRATARTQYAALSAFGAWCVSVRLLGANPMDGLPKPKEQEKPHRYLSRDELGRVYHACRTDRERLLIRLLLHGLRAGQVLALRWDDLDGDVLTIRQHKRNRVHPVVLDGETVRLLDQLGGHKGDDAVLVDEHVVPLAVTSANRRNAPPRADQLVHLQHEPMIPITYRRLYAIVVEVGKRARVRLTPHTLRHSWASQSLDAGMDALTLQTLGGWANMAMVNRYTKSVQDQAAVKRAREFGIVGHLLD